MSIAKTVNLHGGPMHGQHIALPVGERHFHVQEDPSPNPADWYAAAPDPNSPLIPVHFRRGTYSSAHGSPTEFEWDGWRDHE